MQRCWIVVFLACSLGGCKKKPKEAGDRCSGLNESCTTRHCVNYTCTTGDIGAACESPSDCNDSNGCFEKKCRAPAASGDACGSTEDCQTNLTRADGKCLANSVYYAAQEVAARNRDAEKEKRMLEQAGVVASPTAETTVHSPGPGTRVRTVTITAQDTAFAACKPDERVIGGGCKTADSVRSSYPSGQSEQDTVGARWNCIADGEVTAYALCSKLPAQ